MQKELEDLNALSQESRAVVTLDQQSVGRLSRMDAMQQQAMANATNQRRQLDLKRIKQALGRLEDNDYGFCDKCEEEIPTKRLAVNPLATRCTNCTS